MAQGGDIGGAIRVTLRPDGTRVGAVEIASTRPVQAARIFVGKPVAEMTETIGRVFSLCGKAQTVAALRAVETALGIVEAPGVRAARDLARLSEMLTQTAMRLGLHWPRVLGIEMDPGLVRACLATEMMIEREVLGEGWRIPGAGVATPADAVGEALAELDLALAAASIGAHLSETLQARGLEGFGALPDGMPPDVGAFARNWDVTAVQSARAVHGAGLAARLAASRADLAALPLEMIATYGHVTPAARQPIPIGSGTATATVETARGPLTHKVEITDGVVTACATEAPTEANFTADGPVAAGLSGAPLDAVAAELHILAIDPCVGCSVEIDGQVSDA